MASAERKEETYGPFEVLERLGIGAMATVHRAIERGINGFERVVALKRLLPHLTEDVEFVRAFVREAKLASLLHHGNIVQLFELGRVGASYFISMEYVRGRDLRVLLRQARRVSGPPPLEVSIVILSQMLEALDYAHGQCDADGNPLGLIHRDISPANLIVSSTGHLKVIDFGIAKATFGSMMTHSGRIKGKLAYMAPEALAGRQLDGRSDLFSASIIAHELLTATPLFAAKDDFQIIDRLQNMQPPQPSSRNPSCPVELDRIIMRGLAKDPDKRWASAADMRAALAEFTVDQRLVATNREVFTWVDAAFQKVAPDAASRLRLPLVAPPNHASAEADDDVMDIVWGGMSTPPTMPVVLDEVPDVSAKVPQSAGPDASYVTFSAAPSAERSTLPGVAASQSSWITPNPRQVTIPPGPAMSTGRTSQQQPQVMLEEAMWAARNAEAMARAAILTRGRRSLMPMIIASVAVTAAGGGAAWFITKGRSEPAAVAKSSGQGAQIPPETQPAAVAQAVPPAAAPRAGNAPGGVAPASSAPTGSAVVTPIPDDSGQGGRGEQADDDADARGDARRAAREDDRDDDRRSRRARARRDSSARERRRNDDERKRDDDERELASSDESDSLEPDMEVQEVEPPAAPAPASTTVARTTESPARDVGLLPAPIEPPAEKPAPARAASAPPAATRASGPIVVSASRAQRASGNDRPIRFPHGEHPPPKITAKMCVDTNGTVTSVTVLSTVSAKVRQTVERALSQWQYRPVIEGGDKVAACFATAFPVQID